MKRVIACIIVAGAVIAMPSGCTPGGKGSLIDGPRISSKTHLASAQMLEASGNLAGASAQYEAVIQNDPNMALAYHRLSILYVKLGQFEKAHQTLQAAIEKGADEASLRNNLGYTLMQMNRFDDAEQMFDAALAISPFFHRARMNLAILHAKAGRTEDALSEFANVIPRDQAFYNVAVIRMQERDYLASAWAFSEAANLNPQLPGVREKAAQALALARHAPHRGADEHLLAALAQPQPTNEPNVAATPSQTASPVQTATFNPRPAQTPSSEFLNNREPQVALPLKTIAVQPKKQAFEPMSDAPSTQSNTPTFATSTASARPTTPTFTMSQMEIVEQSTLAIATPSASTPTSTETPDDTWSDTNDTTNDSWDDESWDDESSATTEPQVVKQSTPDNVFPMFETKNAPSTTPAPKKPESAPTVATTNSKPFEPMKPVNTPTKENKARTEPAAKIESSEKIEPMSPADDSNKPNQNRPAKQDDQKEDNTTDIMEMTPIAKR